MKFMFDTANVEDIKEYKDIFPIVGITSNPSIIKKEGKIDFFNHFKEIRKILGFEKSIHIQVVAENCEGIIKDAETILENIDNKIYIKIPVTEEGLKAMKLLKSKGANITATAVYTKIQSLLALETGADFIAPYFNRMENIGINPRDVIETTANMINKYNYSTEILTASFRNIGQVVDAFSSGSQAVTVPPQILHDSLMMPSIQKAVGDFTLDWENIFGKEKSIYNL
ncbi:MAG: fructose-6-phosphate aldolase [Tissierellaceae bacterium]|nr:fructose-6-phosphate aldolase [Tissierellaceae bacterium]